MTTRTYCDGCGHQVGNTAQPNYWHATLMGDTLRASDGRMIEYSGITGQVGTNRSIPLSKVDLCIPCMSKTQEENTK